MILAVDQGTTATTCLVVDDELRVLGRGTTELPQHFPRPGWVEHDPEEIWATVLASAHAALTDAELAAPELDTVAIANQRETMLLWDRRTGTPVAPAIVWQDRRTADRCARLDRELIRERTGLVPDPYFSATKLEWLLDRTESRDGLAFGTVDSWLAWRLTRGTRHVTDATNASRTMLCSIETLDWDDELLALFGVERSLLPEIVGSGDVVGEGELFGTAVEVRGLAGDQQSSLYGHGCHRPGEGKATYGTGSFVLVHTGSDASPPPHGLLRTAAADGYALEGAILVAGAALQWLRDGLGLISSASESESLAASVEDAGGVVFVPALAGLGSPWWDADARGLITGLTRGTTRAATGASGPRGDRPPGRGRGRVAPRAARGAPRRRRRNRQPLPHAAPGRPVGHACRGRRRPGDHRARRGRPRGGNERARPGRRRLRAAPRPWAGGRAAGRLGGGARPGANRRAS